MTANELRNQFLSYYQERRHELVAAASLVPDDDASVLYTTAGMQPLIPYLLGKKHPKGNRLANIQRCVRTCDIEEVGDDYHLTVFEMLGNWSLGDYFKEESITMSYTFLTEILGIPKTKIAVTVHKGNANVEEDAEAVKAWEKMGLAKSQIFYYGDDENWWGPAGETGPCGPDSEMFYVNDLADCSEGCGPACHCGKYVELGNNVFMTYNKDKDGSLTPLAQKNIDVGLGFERLLILANGFSNVYETDLFQPIIIELENLTKMKYEESTKMPFRVISEHIRASVFIMADSKRITPSNSEQGYILRRLIRRSIRMALQLGVTDNILPDLAKVVIACYQDAYPEVKDSEEIIMYELNKEYARFSRTLQSGLKIANKFLDNLDHKQKLQGENAFRLYDTFGFPLELTIELAKEREKDVDVEGFWEHYGEHQNKSRMGAAEKFKGGLAENCVDSTRLHTATHLLNSALRSVLGETVYQRGSHVNAERLRFDFSFDRTMTKDEIQRVEEIVNEAISLGIEVEMREMSVDKAKALGAIGIFDSTYGEKVKVYEIGDFSLEICGGPHAKNTAELGSFRIIKEQSSSAGIRRIKAVISQ